MRKIPVLILVAAATAGATTFQWDETVSGGYVVIHKGEFYEGSLGVFGGYCEVNGTINGDLTVCGGDVRVNGEVTGDVFAAGGNVVVDGNCEGKTTAFGGSVTLLGNFSGPTEAAGGSARLGGNFAGPVEASGGVVWLEGNFSGPVEATGEKVLVESDANLSAGLSYAGELVRDPAAIIEGPVTVIEREEEEAAPEPEAGFSAAGIIAWLAWRIGEFLALMVLGFLIWLVRPNWLITLPEKMRTKPWQTPLAGLVFVIALDLITFLLFVTVIGIPSALIIVALSLTFLYASWVFVGTFAGNLILKPMFKGKEYPALFATAVGGLVLIFLANLLWLIPFYVGCFLYLLLCLAIIWYGFGAGLFTLWTARKKPA